jgi:hypothetical protein
MPGYIYYTVLLCQQMMIKSINMVNIVNKANKIQGHSNEGITPEYHTVKSISIVFCISAIRHDSSLSKYRKQKQSPPRNIQKWHTSRGVTASVYGTC